VSIRIVGINFKRLEPLRDGGFGLACFRQLQRAVIQVVELARGHIDLENAVLRDVYELGNIYGAVRCRGVLDQDRRTIPAFFVQVRQKHLGIGRAALRGKHQPAAIGGKAMPGVHQGRIAPALRRALPPSAGII
jgi:hypothetical protein